MDELETGTIPDSGRTTASGRVCQVIL